MTTWKDKFIQPNQYSRPQKKITAVRKIVIHWTANYGATANGHYNYFNNLKDRYASAHFFVDKTEALCIIPLNEIAYHANDGTYKGVAELKPNANFLSLGVEMCVEKDGSFHPDTIARTIKVVAELCEKYNLDPMTDIVRHYDVTHKSCPTPWVKDSAKFTAFKKSVDAVGKKEVSKPVAKPSTAKTHTVEKGETFYAIAKQYDMTVEKLQGYNPRVKADDLQVGDVIHLIPVPASVVEKPKVEAKPKPVAKPKPATTKLTYKRTLESGMSGADVKALQTALNKLNFNCGTPDGVYGKGTKDAVTRFQKVNLPYEVDGIAGKDTINKINSLLK